MKTNKPHLIFIAKTNEQQDILFYKSLLRTDNPLFDKYIVSVFSRVDQFVSYIKSMPIDFEFSVLVHSGLKAMTEGLDGIDISNRLQKELPKLQFEFTSRDSDKPYHGRRTYQTNLLPLTDLSEIPINKVGTLLKLDDSLKESKTYDFGVITALFDDEFTAFNDNMTLEPLDQFNTKMGAFQESKFDRDYKKDFLVSWQSKMGMVDAAALSSKIITEYDPTFLILAGVCGGREEEVNLYDVIIPTNIHDYLSGKFKNGKFVPRPLLAAVNGKMIDFLKERVDDIYDGMRALSQGSLKNIINGGFKIHFKDYACGPWVVKTDGKILEIAEEINDDIVGLEMESLGMMRACNRFAKEGRYGIVVKSVMDFTDMNKKDGDKGAIKTNAALISYLCVRAIMPMLIEFKEGLT